MGARPAYLGFAFVAVALAWIDADVHRLPRGLTRPAYPLLVAQLALASLASGDWEALRRAAIAGLALWGVYLVLAVLAALLGSGFGLGDVTLAGLVGLATGYVASRDLVASYAAFLLAGCLRRGRIVLRRGTRKDDIAFGPWMLVGTLIAVRRPRRRCSEDPAATGVRGPAGRAARGRAGPRGRIEPCCVG